MAFTQKKIYIKDESFDPIYRSLNKEFYMRSRFFPGILLALGFIVLSTQVIYPLVIFKTHDEVSTPAASSVLGVATGFSQFKFNELSHETESNTAIKKEVPPKYFKVSIPKLGIKDAVTETNSLELSPDLSLGHYRGSGLPGEVGNAFIYGHSVLPWFFNPKNYKTIFSTLDQLEVGDEIHISYNDKNYTYKVEAKEILPTDKVQPLAEYKPKYLNESTITLMTCWPAGTKAKRLLVKAVMVG
jgi:LPXTG-site transpeptidase (sortase) family protein